MLGIAVLFVRRCFRPWLHNDKCRGGNAASTSTSSVCAVAFYLFIHMAIACFKGDTQRKRVVGTVISWPDWFRAPYHEGQGYSNDRALKGFEVMNFTSRLEALSILGKLY